jgi:hypothetical protein
MTTNFFSPICLHASNLRFPAIISKLALHVLTMIGCKRPMCLMEWTNSSRLSTTERSIWDKGKMLLLQISMSSIEPTNLCNKTLALKLYLIITHQLISTSLISLSSHRDNSLCVICLVPFWPCSRHLHAI